MKKNMELYGEPESYFNSLGFTQCGQYEWENKNGWTIEYMGTNERPYCWRIDDFNNEGHQILFLDLKTRSDLEWLINHIT